LAQLFQRSRLKYEKLTDGWRYKHDWTQSVHKFVWSLNGTLQSCNFESSWKDFDLVRHSGWQEGKFCQSE
jgi:hypothetical protein